MASSGQVVVWQQTEVKSPHMAQPVPVVAAKDIPYVQNGHRFQTLNVYLPRSSETDSLVGQPVGSLPGLSSSSPATPPRWQVHIHGGAWRDPQLTAASIEATVAHAFNGDQPGPIAGIASLNYTLSDFPTHPTLPYDAARDNHADPSREAVHPQHVRDVLRGLALLKSLGLTDGSYILTGHSAGACLSFQAIYQAPRYWRLASPPGDEISGVDPEEPPTPAAHVAMNGLYDLPDLVDGLGGSHAQLRDVYADLLGRAFGRADQAAASPARFEVAALRARMAEGRLPRLVVLDQSDEDQLVPMAQTEKLEVQLREVDGLQVQRGHRCTGRHAAPWEEGIMIWENLLDVLKALE